MNQPETALALGCSVATVSRLCSGDRAPSLELMKEIRRVFSWGIEAQVRAVDRGTFPSEFQAKMDRRRMRQRMRRGRVREG
jgi:transcriptional regulator with XRE-family HTH domain